MSTILYPQEKAFNDISALVEFFVEIVFCEGFELVGNTNCAALRLNKITNISRTKSLIAKYRFAIKIYFAQKFCGTLRIMNVSTGQQQPDELKIFSNKSVNFGVLAAT